MKTVLIILASIFVLGLTVNGYRKIKLTLLQRHRNNCDLTTDEGLKRAQEYNDKINKLMNVSSN